MKKIIINLIIISICFCLFGCAEMPLKKTMDKMTPDMDTQIGILTYDEALTTFGSPTTNATGDKIIIATWTWQSTAYVPIGNVLVPATSGESLTLIFNKRTHLLEKWKYTGQE